MHPVKIAALPGGRPEHVNVQSVLGKVDDATAKIICLEEDLIIAIANKPDRHVAKKMWVNICMMKHQLNLILAKNPDRESNSFVQHLQALIDLKLKRVEAMKHLKPNQRTMVKQHQKQMAGLVKTRKHLTSMILTCQGERKLELLKQLEEHKKAMKEVMMRHDEEKAAANFPAEHAWKWQERDD